MKKKIISAILCASMVAGILAGCGGSAGSSTTEAGKTEGTQAATQAATQAGTTEAGTTEAKGETAAADDTEKADANTELSGTLVVALWDNVSMQLFEDLDLAGKFQEVYPDANIEFEKLKDDSEYWNAMKMRASANQLPDIMFNKTFTLSRFKDYLVDLSDTEANKNNNIAQGYAVDGKVLGLPEKMTAEYVYYWKDMFKEAGVEVPTTWSELEEVSKKLQDHFGAENGDFMAIAMGGKDEWPTYPFTEFMPALESGNGQNWNTMATQDEPFSEGTDFYKAYTKINSLFTSGVFGKDPVGIGNDQATALFAQKQAAMVASGGWALTSISEGADSTDELGTFYLPTRDTAEDPFRAITQGDNFMSITTHAKNPDLAKAFVEFYFSDAWYPEYIKSQADDNTMKTVQKDKDPILAQADELQPDKELVMYDGGGDDFTALVAETTFDYKKLGAEMLVSGFDLPSALNDLNTKWKAAREKLDIK